MSNGLFVFGAANTSGRLNQSDAMLNHLSTCQKANLQCVSLVASQDFSCQTGVIGNLTVSGELIVKGGLEISGDLTVDGVLQVCDIQCPADLSITAVGNITTTSTLGDINSTATGSINSTATGGINSTATGDITQNSSTGDVNVNLADGDLRIATDAHLVFLGSGNVTVTGLGTWVGATFTLSNATDTAGVIKITGLPAVGITQGDGFSINFARPYVGGPPNFLHGWLSANLNLSVLIAQQAAAGIALSGYYTNTSSTSVEFIFVKTVPAIDIQTFTGSGGYTQEMDFSYFVVESVA